MTEPMSMYDYAVAWVENHRAVCSGPPCDCATSDPQRMIDGLLAHWLGGEDD